MTSPNSIYFGAASEYYRRLIGGAVEPLESSGTVGTTDTEVKGADPECVQLTIINLSANTMYLRPNRTASSTSGIRLAANGGAISMDVTRDGTLPAQSWHLVADAAPSAYYIVGVRRATRDS